MYNELDFSDIAPFRDHEVKDVLDRLKKDLSFLHLLEYMQLDSSPPAVEQLLAGIETVDAFQLRISRPWLLQFFDQTTTEITHDGLTTLGKDQKYLFISNHRDIALDSAILNVLLSLNNIQSVETAIGDNLLKFPIVKTLAKLNKNFTVNRSAGAREMYQHSLKLSAYIRKRIVENKSSVWIAQREGRAKDGNDKTQQGVVKMLNLSNEAGFEEGCKALHIRPMAMSYEYDPCDRYKVKELLTTETGQTYAKEEEEDFKNIVAGFLGQKGRVHLSIQPVLDSEIDQLAEIRNTNDKINRLTEMIDRAIYRGYRLFENNYIAQDLLQGGCEWMEFYTPEQKQFFVEYADKVCEGLPPRAREILFKKYAYPLINQNAPGS